MGIQASLIKIFKSQKTPADTKALHKHFKIEATGREVGSWNANNRKALDKLAQEPHDAEGN